MKKQLLILSAFLISMTVFGQKDELKMASKAIDAKDYAKAMTVINQAEGLVENADQKTKAKFYYLKALALYQGGSKQADLKKVSAAFNDVVEFEKESNKLKYTSEINGLSQKLVEGTVNEASEAYQKAVENQADADYKLAAEKFYTVYSLSPKDTMFLDNSAFLFNKAKDYENSIKYSQELLDIGYTGITTEYIATGIDGKDITYPDKKTMDAQVRLKVASNPRVEPKESRRNIFYNILAENNVSIEDYDAALEVIAKGREEFPKNFQLLITEANIYFKKGNKVKFKELLEEAVQIDPTNVSLYQNIGIMYKNENNIDEAMKNFNKVLELDPNNSDAYNNIGATILDKTKPLQEEMNKSLSDFDKYDRLLNEQKEIYKESLPYYEKAYELNKSNISVVQILVGLYENLDMSSELTEMQAVYDSLKE
ncbi:tetratricopeptide repeat protein [Lutibacter holmesii]|uniref:Tetratricopeptide repeat protein n=1 Tax=Lutibacter holmesii TaxID=1137985 RepID=A0ABW3WMJ5_9FLAO